MSSSAKAAEQLPGKLQHAHIPFPYSFIKQRFQAVLNVAHSQEPQSSEGRMTQSSWLQCQEGLSPWTRETPWLYTEAHLDKKICFSTCCILQAASCCCSTDNVCGCWFTIRKFSKMGGGRLHPLGKSKGIPSSRSLPLETHDEPLIRDTAKKSLLSVQTE